MLIPNRKPSLCAKAKNGTMVISGCLMQSLQKLRRRKVSVANTRRYVLRVAKEKPGTPASCIARGMLAYYCLNAYVANVCDMRVYGASR